MADNIGYDIGYNLERLECNGLRYGDVCTPICKYGHVFDQPIYSAQSCEDLGKSDNIENGGIGVQGVCGFSGRCLGKVTKVRAERMCEHIGARLCTTNEILNLEAAGTECAYDNEYVMTSTPCMTDGPTTSTFDGKYVDGSFKAAKANPSKGEQNWTCVAPGDTAFGGYCCADVERVGFDSKGLNPEKVNGVMCGDTRVFLPPGELACTQFEASEIYSCTGAKLALNPNVGWEDDCGNSHSSTCAAFCANGYDQFGSTFARCDFGQWIWNDPSTAPYCTPSPCRAEPVLMFGDFAGLLTCIGREHGDFCQGFCVEGYEWAGIKTENNTEGGMICQFGQWVIPGVCVESRIWGGKEVVRENVVTVTAIMDVSAPQAGDETAGDPVAGAVSSLAEPGLSVDYQWAVLNEDAIAGAIAGAIGVDSSRVQVEIIPISQLQEEAADIAEAAADSARRLAFSQYIRGLPLNGRRLDGHDFDEDDYSSQAFGMKVVIWEGDEEADSATGSAIDSSKNPNIGQVENRLECLLSQKCTPEAAAAIAENANTNSSNASGQGAFAFVKLVTEELEELGRPVPKDLQSASLTQTSPVVNIPNLIMPEATFATTEWGVCAIPGSLVEQQGDWLGTPEQQTCGRGIQHRVVKCLRGKAKGACTDTRPDLTQKCKDYEGCPWLYWCPLGQDPEETLPCEQQEMIMIGIHGAISFCLLAFCARRIQLKCRKPKKGVVNIKVESIDMKMTWNSELRERDRLDTEEELPAQPGFTKKKLGTHKEHIVWEVDQSAVNDFLEQNRQEPGEIARPLSQIG